MKNEEGNQRKSGTVPAAVSFERASTIIEPLVFERNWEGVEAWSKSEDLPLQNSNRPSG